MTEDFNIRQASGSVMPDNERDLERALRPSQFDSFSGQDKIVENLKVFVTAARMRGEALDHILLFGPPGLGKTTLAVSWPMNLEWDSRSHPALCLTNQAIWRYSYIA